MSSTANVDLAEQAYRPPSDTPFLVSLGIISSVYVLLLIGLLRLLLLRAQPAHLKDQLIWGHS